MARMIVRNYFKPNAAQNGCNAITTTADGLNVWSCDQGDQLAVERDGVLYRIAYNRPEHVEQFNQMNFTERNNAAVERDAARVRGDESATIRMATPAQYELAGRLDEWRELGQMIETRKANQERFKLEKESQEAAETEKLYQQLLDAAADDFKKGTMIAAEMFEGLLTRHGIKVAPKTMGWIRRGLVQVGQDRYSFDKRYNKSTTVMGYASQLLDCLTGAGYLEKRGAEYCKTPKFDAFFTKQTEG